LYASDWLFVKDQSKLNFSVNYENQPIEGMFKHFTVEYKHNTSLHVNVDVASADMGSPDINAEIIKSDWFDVAKFNIAQFTANSIEKLDETHFVAHGNLVLKGISKTLDLPFTLHNIKNGMSLEGSVNLKRSEFSIGGEQWVSGSEIGLDVKVSFNVTLKERG
jgi:polyisoprenoid-binding protein YceI